jgi:Lar family restriction alleviation protein
MKETELKPCPFCGGEAEYKTFTTGRILKFTAHYIACSVCGCQTNVQFTNKEAATKWNRRADHERKAD